VTTFHLIRHAEKDSPPELITARAPGIHLTAAGLAQAERLAHRLAAAPLAAIYSSPLERARETAEPLARLRGLYVRAETAFHEMDFGAWAGRNHRELAADPEWQRFNRCRGTTAIPGGESYLDVQARFVNEMLRIHRQHPEGTVAIFSHADPIRAALAYFAGAPPDPFDRFEVGLASISTITVDPFRAQVVCVNAGP
jgi:probable phosphoglycerate mutase